jgi:hypothetical protein
MVARQPTGVSQSDHQFILSWSLNVPTRSLSEIDFRFRGEGGASFFKNHLV